MQTNILWTGREYYSLENCLITASNSGSVITSTIIGLYQNQIYQVDYRIQTNLLWETLLVEINSRHNNQIQSIRLENDGAGNWLSNGQPANQFRGCADVDIPLTPFTNSLPINRLKLVSGQQKEIQVIYLDLLEKQINPVRQKYNRRSDTEYQYENVPNDFEATITVDEAGFVVDYPALFFRKHALPTNYH